MRFVGVLNILWYRYYRSRRSGNARYAQKRIEKWVCVWQYYCYFYHICVFYTDYCLRSQVQRIVITSSCAAITQPQPLSKPTVFSECDWNELAVKEVREKGNKTQPLTMYRASKTLAEKSGFFELYLAFRCPSHLSGNQVLGSFMSSTNLRFNGI